MLRLTTRRFGCCSFVRYGSSCVDLRHQKGMKVQQRDENAADKAWREGKVVKLRRNQVLLDRGTGNEWIPIKRVRGFADWARRVRNPEPFTTTLDVPGVAHNNVDVQPQMTSEVRVFTNGAQYGRLSPHSCSVVVLFDKQRLHLRTLQRHAAIPKENQLPHVTWEDNEPGDSACLALELPDVALPVFRGQTIVFSRGDIIRHLRAKAPLIDARDVADFMECIDVVRLTFRCEPDSEGRAPRGCMLEHMQVSVCPAMGDDLLQHIACAGLAEDTTGAVWSSHLGICWECMAKQLGKPSSNDTETHFQPGDIVKRGNSQIGIVASVSSGTVGHYSVRIFGTDEVAVCTNGDLQYLHPRRPEFEVGDIVRLSGSSSDK